MTAPADFPLPSLLLTFAYEAKAREVLGSVSHRSWALDSGAFTAWRKGKPFPVEAYIEGARRFLDSDDPPVDVFALDAIGDPEMSWRNYVAMRDAGINCIPTFHAGSPESALKRILRSHKGKIALGGIVGTTVADKTRIIREFFARVWPRKVHGFGVHLREHLMGFPFHSTDSVLWGIYASRYGLWRAFGNLQLGIPRSSGYSSRPEIERYLTLEREAQTRWAKEMKMLDEADGDTREVLRPSFRFGDSGCLEEDETP